MNKLQKNIRKTKRFERIMNIAYWIADLPNKLTPAPFRLMQIGSLFWQSRSLYLATKLGIADVILSEPMATKDIAKKLNLFEPNLYRLMRFLASIGIFKEVSHKVFAHNKLSLPLVRSQPNCVSDMILMHNCEEMTLPWMDAMEAGIKDGEIPFVQCHGSEMFSYMNNNKELNDLFANAMDSVESLTGLDYLQDFNWRCFDRIIDLGGSKGSKSIAILAENTTLTSVVFDRDAVTHDAKESWKNKINDQILDRITYVGGDLFSSNLPIPTSDKNLYLLIAIFHLLDDADSVALLKRITASMDGINASIAIVDAVLPETQASITQTSFDMQMLMGTKGCERTATQWHNLFEQANLELVETVAIRTFAKVMVLIKRS
ncbi:methyltransferase [Colwellia demingiae]|uniref:Methyltransferase n=1 Tax=Colwellia demingiae TaxID=89401 RepID=A0A5C6Q6A0_9GAMM|nr:methyltransferase [Colwellia demingiae]TWX64332.1 methyltransferase [Colwellia demingiae]